MKSFSIFTAFFLFSCTINAQRIKNSFNHDWQFLAQSEIKGATENDWKPVLLPHTWNLDAYERKDYKRGQRWYRKTFTVPDSLGKKEIYIRFDAVNSYAEVYLNDTLLATHSGGYAAFNVYLPKQQLQSSNTIRVLVDNRNIDIPPLSGDFTIFGGIYRNVWMIAVEKEHFDLDNFGSPGIFISTSMVTRELASVHVKGVVINPDHSALSIQLQLKKDGKTVLSKNIKPSSGGAWQMNDLVIKNPQLWSPDTPNLYSAHLQLIKGKKVIDALHLPVGFRWFSADTKNGFKLNGEPLKLLGTNRHQDQYPFGIAVPQWVHENDIRLIKKMGANFLRLAHYQQDDKVLRLCDSLGLIVWEEIPVVDIIGNNETFKKNARSQLKEMVRQHYNHPSVIFWGYMNEAIIQVQYRIPKEQQQAFYQKTVALAKDLEQLLKMEDSSRLSVMACHGSNLYNEIGLAGITDVLGWNLYQGWYGGDLDDFEKFTDAQNTLFPGRPLIISEFGAGSDMRIHTLHPETFDFSIEYQQKFLEHYLPQILTRPYIIGATEWNFIDFNVASRQESMPRTNNKGLVYNNRRPKDVYYYFKSFLRNDTPVVHIASDDWRLRDEVSDDDSAVVPLKVYSNQQEVQLIVNEKVMHKKPVQNYSAQWNIQVPEGISNIVAVAFENGAIKARDTFKLTTRFTPFSTLNTPEKNWDLAINVGSNCSFYDAEKEITWLADKSYSAGSWGYVDGSVFRKSPGRIGTTTEIAGTQDDPLFQTIREDIGTYRIDAPPGKYEIELLFADLYQAPPASAYLLPDEDQGKRGLNVFDVSVNGNIVFPDVAPYILSGNQNNAAVSRRIVFENTSRSINIGFLKKHGHSFLNAIRVKKL